MNTMASISSDMFYRLLDKTFFSKFETVTNNVQNRTLAIIGDYDETIYEAIVQYIIDKYKNIDKRNALNDGHIDKIEDDIPQRKVCYIQLNVDQTVIDNSKMKSIKFSTTNHWEETLKLLTYKNDFRRNGQVIKTYQCDEEYQNAIKIVRIGNELLTSSKTVGILNKMMTDSLKYNTYFIFDCQKGKKINRAFKPYMRNFFISDQITTSKYQSFKSMFPSLKFEIIESHLAEYGHCHVFLLSITEEPSKTLTEYTEMATLSSKMINKKYVYEDWINIQHERFLERITFTPSKYVCSTDTLVALKKFEDIKFDITKINYEKINIDNEFMKKYYPTSSTGMDISHALYKGMEFHEYSMTHIQPAEEYVKWDGTNTDSILEQCYHTIYYTHITKSDIHLTEFNKDDTGLYYSIRLDNNNETYNFVNLIDIGLFDIYNSIVSKTMFNEMFSRIDLYQGQTLLIRDYKISNDPFEHIPCCRMNNYSLRLYTKEQHITKVLQLLIDRLCIVIDMNVGVSKLILGSNINRYVIENYHTEQKKLIEQTIYITNKQMYMPENVNDAKIKYPANGELRVNLYWDTNNQIYSNGFKFQLSDYNGNCLTDKIKNINFIGHGNNSLNIQLINKTCKIDEEGWIHPYSDLCITHINYFINEIICYYDTESDIDNQLFLEVKHNDYYDNTCGTNSITKINQLNKEHTFRMFDKYVISDHSFIQVENGDLLPTIEEYIEENGL